MSNSFDGKLFRRLAALERRVSKLENAQDEFDRVINPQGWIGEAFEKQEEHIDEQFAQVKVQLNPLEGKLDAVLQRLTGGGY